MKATILKSQSDFSNFHLYRCHGKAVSTISIRRSTLVGACARCQWVHVLILLEYYTGQLSGPKKSKSACVNAMKARGWRHVVSSAAFASWKVSNLGARVLTPFVNGDHAWRVVAWRDSLRAGR